MFEQKHQVKENSIQTTRFSAAQIAEMERSRIAANIHDDIGMMLIVLKMNLNRAIKNIQDPTLTKEILLNAHKTIEDTIESVRVISNDLMPHTLAKLGFIPAVIEMCEQVNTTNIINVRWSIPEGEFNLDKSNEIQLYWLTKEVISNILKHSHASTLDLRIIQDKNHLKISFFHDGKGITTSVIKQLSKQSKGIGLKSILGRVEALKGSLKYIVLKKSSKIVLWIPLI
ncbi:MAG: putative signal transduction histidine kinase [Bacteroidetes bacterium]|nr:putative signal transduction histidine kinase [Bacteroidota bacterium]